MYQARWDQARAEKQLKMHRTYPSITRKTALLLEPAPQEMRRLLKPCVLSRYANSLTGDRPQRPTSRGSGSLNSRRSQ